MKTNLQTADMSQLTEDIIHHILSYMESTRKAFRVSMVCKSWYNAWLTCPTLSFITYNSGLEEVNLINRVLLRYEEQKIPIERLKLCLYISKQCSDSHVKEWIRIAVQNGVKRLALNFYVLNNSHTLSRTIFEATSLRELTLRGHIEQVGGEVMFNHLDTLNLCNIDNIDEDMFQGIVARCPFIENLCVENCYRLERIKVCTLYNLKNFTVRAGRKVDVEIEAPNLQFLQVMRYDNHRGRGSLKLYKTEKLIGLELAGDIYIPSTFLDNWEHKYPQIKNLNLSDIKVKMVSISSLSLKHIKLTCEDLREINIDAPNLVSLELRRITVFPDLSLVKTRTQMAMRIFLLYCPLDTNQFCELKQLLAKWNHCKISLDLSLTCEAGGFVDVGKIQTYPMVLVEDLKLKFPYSTKLVHSNFLEALFLTCHPKALLVESHECDLLLFLSMKLIQTRKNWSSNKELEVEVYDHTKQQWRPSDYQSLAKTPNDGRTKACYRLTWEATLS